MLKLISPKKTHVAVYFALQDNLYKAPSIFHCNLNIIAVKCFSADLLNLSAKFRIFLSFIIGEFTGYLINNLKSAPANF